MRATTVLGIAASALAVAGVATGAALLTHPVRKPATTEAASSSVPSALRLAPESAPVPAFREGPEPGLPTCAAGAVSGTMTDPTLEHRATDGRDVVTAVVGITNNAGRCNLDGAEVTGAVVDADGQALLPTPDLAYAGVGHPFPPPLEPGASATTTLTWSRWCGGSPGAWSVRVRVNGAEAPARADGTSRPVPQCWQSAGLADQGAIADFGPWTMVNQYGQPAANPQSALRATFTAPASAAFGDTLRTTLRLDNPSAGPISLSPCPRFTWSVSNAGPNGFLNSGWELELNCPAAPDNVPAGGSVTFGLELPLTANLADGTFLTGRWWISPGLSAAAAPIDITEPTTAPPATSPCEWAVAPDATPRVAGTPPQQPSDLPTTAVVHTNRGDITIGLNRSGAPCAVSAFRYLVDGGYWTSQPARQLSNTGTFHHLDFGASERSFRRAGFGFAAEVTRDQQYPAGTVVLPMNERLTQAGALRLLYGPAPTYGDNFTILGHITDGLAILEQVAAGGQRDGEYGGPREPLTIQSVELR